MQSVRVTDAWLYYLPILIFPLFKFPKKSLSFLLHNFKKLPPILCRKGSVYTHSYIHRFVLVASMVYGFQNHSKLGAGS